MIPGGNLLNLALSVIAPSSLRFYAFASRVSNALGVFETTYAPPVQIWGSVQAVPRTLYHDLGLDLQKDYAMLYAARELHDIGRGTAGDRVDWNGSTWQLISESDWFAIDGWVGVMMVRVGPAPATGITDNEGAFILDDLGLRITDNEGL